MSGQSKSNGRTAEQATYGVLWALFKLGALALIIAVAVIVGVNLLAK